MLTDVQTLDVLTSAERVGEQLGVLAISRHGDTPYARAEMFSRIMARLNSAEWYLSLSPYRRKAVERAYRRGLMRAAFLTPDDSED